jgi:DNA-directed RNA polymerase specialized sigma subunit
MKKHLRVRNTTGYEKSVGSPYWAYLLKSSYDEDEIQEPAIANPDVLDEDKSIWHVDEELEYFNFQRKKKLQSVLRRVLNKLTKTDKDIVTLMSQGCHNFSKIAEKIGMSRGFVEYRVKKIQELSSKMMK